MSARAIIVPLLVAAACTAGSGATGPAGAQTVMPNGHRPIMVFGRSHPGHITGQSNGGLAVKLRDGGTQAIQFGEIWRIRRAYASDEPQGTAVIDFANIRIFVATPVASLVGDARKRIPLVQFTAPNGEAVYMAADKVTDISNALPGLHNPLSKAVIGTRDGAQQVTETADIAKRIVAEAHTAP